MDAQQMEEEMQKLTNAIAILLSDFTRHTDLQVEHIDITHISLSDTKVRYLVGVEVSL